MTGYTLKMIAIIAMLIDHTGYMLVDQQKNFEQYVIFRMIGRLAFPIFCFLLVEGYMHTRDVKKYLIRLFIFALFSEVPFNMAISGQIFDISHQSVYVTLFLGLFTIHVINWCYEDKHKNKMDQVLWMKLIYYAVAASITFLMGEIAIFFDCDYDYKGIWLISALYVFRSNRLKQMLAGSLTIIITTVRTVYGMYIDGHAQNFEQFIANLIDTINNAGNMYVDYAYDCTKLQSNLCVWMSLFAIGGLVIALLYNGKRGKSSKYMFYMFYPLHLLFLVFIKMIVY